MIAETRLSGSFVVTPTLEATPMLVLEPFAIYLEARAFISVETIGGPALVYHGVYVTPGVRLSLGRAGEVGVTCGLGNIVTTFPIPSPGIWWKGEF
jgi:hypothetical protein